MYKFVNYKMKEKEVINHIVNWIKDYHKVSKTSGFVIGISGGIDSALTSTLIAKTKLPFLCLEMPIHQHPTQISRGKKHISWIKKNFKNAESKEIDLSSLFDSFVKSLPVSEKDNHELALVNAKARFRMTTLYYYAQLHNYLVVGTGNKVEDFGIGFFTKHGDGGVDINPIADLLKTEVYKLSKRLQVCDDILTAAPTDGLWGDNKTDEDQIGATYPELEWAMNFSGDQDSLSENEKKILSIYKKFNIKNQHKMNDIPVCKIPNILR